MITIQYGGWTPDLANVAFQMPDQQGPVIVPMADCLNVYFDNGVYQTLPTSSPVSGSANLPAACVGAFTAADALGNPLIFAGVLGSGTALYQWNGTSWAAISGTTFQGTRWVFAQFGTNVYALDGYAFADATDGLVQIACSGQASLSTVAIISSAPVGRVLATVGQFLMMGDIGVQSLGFSLGTGDGVLTTFTGTLPNTPVRPGTVEVLNNGVTSGPDSGNGGFSFGGYSGMINYSTGVISVTYASPPANGNPITVTYTQAYSSRLQWSAIGNPTNWPIPLTNAALAAQSGIQDLEYKYGPIMFIAGYPLYGVIFQRNAITRASYIGGNVVFSWQTYARNQGLLAKGAAVQVGANTYFLSDAGFFYTDGANVTPIGTAEDNSAGIDGWFFANANLAALNVISAGYDAKKRCIFFAIPTGSNTLPDTLLTYNILAGKWTRGQQLAEFVWIDSDGSTDRLGVFDQSHRYSLLTNLPSAGYLESCDLSFSDGNTRFTPSVRPNIACTGTPTVIVGVRNTLESSITYSAAGTADAFGGGFAPTLSQKGIYTRVRISSGSATALNGATMKMRSGGPL